MTHSTQTTPLRGVSRGAIGLAATLLAAAFALAACSSDADEETSRATQVTSRKQLIGGTNALGEIGDYKLANDEIQVIVQDEGYNRGAGLFGGSLIDADLRRTNQQGGVVDGGNGQDTFAELFPAFFLEVVDPERVEVVNDGSDGEAAVVEVSGTGGEFVTMLRYINQIMVNSYQPKEISDLLSDAIDDELAPPASDQPLVRFSTRYILEPGARHIRIESTIENESFTTLQFPNQSVLDAISGILGLDLEGFTVPAGNVLGFGAINDLFVPGLGYDIRWGLEDAYRQGAELPAFPGKLTDFIASSNPSGISYGYFTERAPEQNFAYQKDQIPGEDDEGLYGGRAEPGDSLLLFYASGFGGAFTHELPARLASPYCDEEMSAEEYCDAEFGDCSQGAANGGDAGMSADAAGGTCEQDRADCIAGYEACLEDSGEHPSSFTFTNYFVVGDGTVSSVTEEMYDIRDVETHRVQGRLFDDQSGSPVGEDLELLVYRPRPNTDDESLPPEDRCSETGEGADKVTPVVFNQTFTGTEGDFEMTLPSGEYCYRTHKSGRPLGGYHYFEVDDADRYLRATADSSAHIEARITSEGGQPMPGKVTVVGTHEYRGETDKRHFLYDLTAGEPWRTSDFVPDRPDEPSTRRYIEATGYASADGVAELHVRPGEYTLYFTRGPEYERISREVDLSAGESSRTNVSLEQVVDTGGYVSGDFHMHAQGSIDTGLDYTKRVVSIAAEDVDVVVSSDHNYVSDFMPYIEREGLQEWMRSIVGVELTTFEFGHFNAFPMDYEVGSINRGSIKWQRVPPQRIFDELRSRGSLGADDTIIQVNHPRDSILGYFSQFNVDGFTAEGGLGYKEISDSQDKIVSTVTMSSGEAFVRDCRPDSVDCIDECPDPPCEEPRFETTLSWDFDALEIFNGKRMELMRHYRVPYDEGEWPADTLRALADEQCDDCESPEASYVRDRCCEQGYASPLDDDPCEESPTEGSCPVDQMLQEVASEAYPEGAVVCDGGDIAYPGGLDDWYNMLNHPRRFVENEPGATQQDDNAYHKVTATGNSDSHHAGKPNLTPPGHPRNYFHVGHDDPQRVTRRDLVDALQNQRNVITNGPFALLEVLDGDRQADVGQQMSVDGDELTLRVSVRAADWIGADRFRIVANGEPLDLSQWNDGLVEAPPDRLDTPQTNAGQHWYGVDLQNGEWSGEFDVEVDRDTWFVLEVSGDQNLFPTYMPSEIPRIPFTEIIGQIAGSFGFGGGLEGLDRQETFPMRPFAFTNPIWIDRAGNGQFEPPGTEADATMACQGNVFDPNALKSAGDLGPRQDPPDRLDTVDAPLDLKDQDEAPLGVPKGAHRDVRTLFRAWGH